MRTIDRIKLKLDEKGIKPAQMMREIGLSSGLFSQWKTGKQDVSKKNLRIIAEYLNVSEAYLQGYDSAPNADLLPTGNIRHIPLFESVAAGFGAYADSTVVGFEPIYIESDWEAEHTIAIKVKGDSMYPKIEDGDVVVVCKDMEYDDGSIVVALIDGDDGVVKRIRLTATKLVLESINPEYQDRVFEYEEMNRVQVVGVVRKIIKTV